MCLIEMLTITVEKVPSVKELRVLFLNVLHIFKIVFIGRLG